MSINVSSKPRMKRTKKRTQRVRSTKKRRAQKLYSTKKRRNQRVRSTKRRTQRIRHKKHVSKRRNKNKYSYKGGEGWWSRFTQCGWGQVNKSKWQLKYELYNNYSDIFLNSLKEPKGIEKFINTTMVTPERKDGSGISGSSQLVKGVVEAHENLQGRLITLFKNIYWHDPNFKKDFEDIKTEFLRRIDNDKDIIIKHIDILLEALTMITQSSNSTDVDKAYEGIEDLNKLKIRFNKDIFRDIKELFTCFLDHMARARYLSDYRKPVGSPF